MERIKCITFDKAAQASLPEDIKRKMKQDRENAEKEADMIAERIEIIKERVNALNAAVGAEHPFLLTVKFDVTTDNSTRLLSLASFSACGFPLLHMNVESGELLDWVTLKPLNAEDRGCDMLGNKRPNEAETLAQIGVSNGAYTAEFFRALRNSFTGNKK